MNCTMRQFVSITKQLFTVVDVQNIKQTYVLTKLEIYICVCWILMETRDFVLEKIKD